MLAFTVMSTDELLAQVLRLPRTERARLAQEVLTSLEDVDGEEVVVAWASELERRSREVADGTVETIDWESARAEVSEELEERRARRTSP